MITIRLLDARRGLHSKCVELFKDAKIAESIYRFLCDGIEECEDAEPEQKKGKWTVKEGELAFWDVCSVCRKKIIHRAPHYKFCPNCGAEMKGEGDGDGLD